MGARIRRELPGLYVDTASADACPQTSHTNGTCQETGYTWNQYDEWWISWGFAAAECVPQMYYLQQANQWFRISWYAALSQGGEIFFSGVLDEYPDDHSTYTATLIL
jgi:hypothetical protein